MHHCIAIGEGAECTKPYQFTLRVRLGTGSEPEEMNTLLSHEEYGVLSRVLRRMYNEWRENKSRESTMSVG